MHGPNGPPDERPGPESRSRAESELEERARAELAPHLQLLRPLGRGSAATVFLAREPSLRRLVAVKVLSPEVADDPKARLRFEREAQSAGRISHPNVVTVYRVDALSDGLPYLVMEYVRGRSLAERLRAEGPLPVTEVRRVLADVASGLAAAHRKRIVHRDVKPANVLHEEETGRVFLTDFGIAAIVASGDEEVARLTTRGHVIGDPRYRSPEQLRGEDVTEPADMYGLGLLGYELLTGRGPYPHESAARLVTAHLRERPEDPRGLRADLDAELAELLLRCLEKVPTHRPTALDVVRLLAPAGGLPPGPAVPLPGASHPSRPPAGTSPAGGPVEADSSGREAGPEARSSTEGGAVASGRGGALAGEPSAPGRAAEPDAAAGEAVDVAVHPPRGVIRLRVLGALELVGADGRRLLSVLAQPKRVALLAYLATGGARGFKRRDTLLGVFWPELEQERARHALRQATYVLRRGLGDEVVVSRGDEELGVEESRLWCDAVAFERAVDAERPREALEWFRGDLLPGFFLSDAPEFERWLEGERQRLRRLASDAAWSLAVARETDGNAAGAAHWARRAQELSPWDESVLCRTIELLDRVGDRAGALQAYDRFARQLHREYDAEPAPETRALIDRIRGR